MDTRIMNVSRPDIVMVESMPRPTPTPVRVSFGQVLAAGASTLVQGAEIAASKVPGSPITAAAIRGGASPSNTTGTITSSLTASSTNMSAEGPGGTGTSVAGAAGTGLSVNVGSTGISVGGTGTDSTGGIDTALQQSSQLSLYYLQVQQEVDSQNRSFTALSNVLKTEHDSAKAAIQNIHS